LGCGQPLWAVPWAPRREKARGPGCGADRAAADGEPHAPHVQRQHRGHPVRPRVPDPWPGQRSCRGDREPAGREAEDAVPASREGCWRRCFGGTPAACNCFSRGLLASLFELVALTVDWAVALQAEQRASRQRRGGGRRRERVRNGGPEATHPPQRHCQSWAGPSPARLAGGDDVEDPFTASRGRPDGNSPQCRWQHVLLRRGRRPASQFMLDIVIGLRAHARWWAEALERSASGGAWCATRTSLQ